MNPGNMAARFARAETGRVVEPGRDWTRAQRCCRDPTAAQLVTQTLGVREHERLGGAVGGLPGHREKTRE